MKQGDTNKTIASKNVTSLKHKVSAGSTCNAL